MVLRKYYTFREMNMKKRKDLYYKFFGIIVPLALIACSNNEKGQKKSTHKNNENVNTRIKDISSLKLVREMKIGWNLGNTLDATGVSGVLSETSWGNPITKKQAIDVIKLAGFNILRIPTTWQNHLGPEPDYIIDKQWLDRVQMVVNYGIENEMIVILNLHHEDWHFPSYDNMEEAKVRLKTIWKQIADHFKDYDEHLILEGMNEPRMKGTNLEWTGGNEESSDVINKLNAVFIDTIRKSGGNNKLRHLMIPPYAASSDPKVWSNFTVPKDNKIIVSIHAYTPYNFALNKTGESVWNNDNLSDTSEIDYLIDNLYNNFISKGIAVVIGEFGAMNKDNLNDRVDWAEYYIKKAAEKNIPCVWWDNGAFIGNGENFGLLIRKSMTWKYPEIVSALMKGLE